MNKRENRAANRETKETQSKRNDKLIKGNMH